jgi:hypothetical protein
MSRVNVSGSYWRVQGLEFRGASMGLVLNAGANNIEVLHNYFNGGAYQLELDSQNPAVPGSPRTGSATPAITDVLVQGNKFANPTEDAIRPQNFRRLRIYENEFYGIVESGSHVDGIQTIDGGDGMDVQRNYWHDNKAQNFFIKDGQVKNLTFVDNLDVRNTASPQGCLATWSMTDVQAATIRRNTEWKADCGGGTIFGHWSGAQSTNIALDHNVLDQMNVTDGQNTAAIVESSNIFGRAPWSKPLGSGSTVNANPPFISPLTDDYRIAGSDKGVTWRPADQHYGP